MQYIITTSLGMDQALVSRAQEYAEKLGISYVHRRKQSIASLLKTVDGVLVVYRDKLVFEQANGKSLFFHPDTAMLRIKAERDPLLELIGSPMKRVLDCTMGLATDSLVMASGGHQVTALEHSRIIHFIVEQGLQFAQTGQIQLDRAMRSIETIWTDSLSYLQEQATDSFDVVYFDPMFSETIQESQNLSGLEQLADYSRLSDELLEEARRVAREKIILKAHFRDQTFEQLGFSRHVRPNQKFHYGELKLKK